MEGCQDMIGACRGWHEGVCNLQQPRWAAKTANSWSPCQGPELLASFPPGRRSSSGSSRLSPGYRQCRPSPAHQPRCSWMLQDAIAGGGGAIVSVGLRHQGLKHDESAGGRRGRMAVTMNSRANKESSPGMMEFAAQIFWHQSLRRVQFWPWQSMPATKSDVAERIPLPSGWQDIELVVPGPEVNHSVHRPSSEHHSNCSRRGLHSSLYLEPRRPWVLTCRGAQCRCGWVGGLVHAVGFSG